jgi:hypothetical protein
MIAALPYRLSHSGQHPHFLGLSELDVSRLGGHNLSPIAPEKLANEVDSSR